MGFLFNSHSQTYTPPEIERLDTIKWPQVQNASPFSKHHFGVSKCSFLEVVFFIVEVWLANTFRPGTIPSTWSGRKCGTQRSTVFWSEKKGTTHGRGGNEYTTLLGEEKTSFIIILCEILCRYTLMRWVSTWHVEIVIPHVDTAPFRLNWWSRAMCESQCSMKAGRSIWRFLFHDKWKTENLQR